MKQGYCPRCGVLGTVNPSGWMRMHPCIDGYKARGGVCVRFLGDPPTTSPAPDRKPKPSTITYPCKVGGGRVVDVTLPADLTSSEMRRICAMLMTQVDPDPDPPHVCPVCHAVSPDDCAPGCIDAEMEAEHRHAIEIGDFYREDDELGGES